MDVSYEMGKIRIRLPKRIDSGNSQEVVDEVLSLNLPADNDGIILDADDLVYISSMGLRIILQLIKQTGGKLIIENVNSDVYEIFWETGFVHLVHIEKKLDYVDVTGLQQLGTGAIGKVYRLNAEQVLKVYIDGRSRDALEEELKTFRAAFVSGLPTMIPFRIVETNEGYGFIFELVMSNLLADSLVAAPEKVSACARDMADLMKELAEKTLDTAIMKNVTRSYEKSLTGIERLVSPDDAELIRCFIRAVPERNTCVHGDLHAGNIMLMDGRLILIDMDDFGYGHPVWEMAQLYAVYQELVREEAIFRKMFSLPGEMAYEDFVMKICHMPSELVSALFDRIRDAYFENLSEADRKKCERVSQIYADILAIRYDYGTIRARDVSGEILDAKKQAAEHYLAKLKKQDLSELPDLFSAWEKL